MHGDGGPPSVCTHRCTRMLLAAASMASGLLWLLLPAARNSTRWRSNALPSDNQLIRFFFFICNPITLCPTNFQQQSIPYIPQGQLIIRSMIKQINIKMKINFINLTIAYDASFYHAHALFEEAAVVHGMIVYIGNKMSIN